MNLVPLMPDEDKTFGGLRELNLMMSRGNALIAFLRKFDFLFHFLLPMYRRGLFDCVSGIARSSGRNLVGLCDVSFRFSGHCCFEYM